MGDRMNVPQKSSGAGGVSLAIVTGIDPVKYRATAKYLDTGGTQLVTFAPTGSFGEIPTEGALCLVYHNGGFFCQLVKVLSDGTPETVLSLSDRLKTGEVPVGTVPALDTGEIYVGRKGKLWFNSAGDIDLMNESASLGLHLDGKLSTASLTCTNYDLTTSGGGIRIITDSSIPGSFGDYLRIEKNVPAPTLPERVTGLKPILANIALIEIDPLGSITASVLAGASMELSELGDAFIGNDFGHFDTSPLGEVSVFSAKNVGVEALLTVDISGNRPGFNVLLNASPVPGDRLGVARVKDLTVSTAATDAIYWAYIVKVQACLTAIYAALTASPIVPLDGGAAYKAGIVAALAAVPLPPVAPVSITSAITTGSLTVTAGG